MDKNASYRPVFTDNGVTKYCNKEEGRLEGPWCFGDIRKG